MSSGGRSIATKQILTGLIAFRGRERWLMEGSYTKVWRARERVPREEYAVLLDGLVGKIRCVQGSREASAMDLKLTRTVRNDIASCHELAYSSLALGEATRLLFFTNENETIEFGKNVVSSKSPGRHP